MAKAKRSQQRSPGGQARRPAAGQQPSAAAKTSASAANGAAKAPASPAASAARANRVGPGRAAAARNPGRFAREPWWRRNLWTLVIVAGTVVLVGVLVWLAQRQNQIASVGVGDPVPAALMTQLEHVSPSVASQVGNGGLTSAMQAAPKGTTPLTTNGKPVVIYVGADYCPYCAASRWSTVVALSRFGTFKGLTLMRSSSSDVYANTPTLSFQKSTYTSAYLVFNATETATRDGTRLATPDATAQRALATYDVAPYTTRAGGIPFYSFGNQYVTTSAIFVPTMLQGLTWQQIGAQLNNPDSAVTKAIVGGANEQTAAICALTNDQPANVCNAAEIVQLKASLPAAK
ncbi:MAG: DUF929 family protein [Chloroflexota bacterium]|nr:DUF929 family protein [Chloroflexota bacterium]